MAVVSSLVVSGTITAATGAAIGAGIAAAGSLAAAHQGKQAAKHQKKSQKIAQQRADAQAARGRRKMVREARIRRAQVESSAQASGAAGSSGAMGATSSIQSQMAEGVGFSQGQQAFSQAISRHNIRAADFQSNAATFQGISNMGSSMSSAFGKFSGPTPPPKPDADAATPPTN